MNKMAQVKMSNEPSGEGVQRDEVIIDKTMELRDSDGNIERSITRYTKVDEVPFDFDRRRTSPPFRQVGL